MALSRPKDSIAQPSITVPGVATGGGTATQGVNATAGSDVQTSSTGAQVLSGGASNGTAPYSYAWTLRTKPSGSSASISSPSSATASLTGIDVGGAYICSVQATDALGFTDSAQVCIDYSAGQSATWYDLIDIDFTSATQGALTANSTTTVDGRDWWYRTPDAGNTSATITSSGLEVDFAGTSNAGMRISTSVNSLLTKTSAGTVPRVRTTIVFSGMVLGTNTSYIGPCMSSFTRNNTVPGLPFIMGRYNRTGSGVYKYSVNARKGSSIGSNAASGSLNTSEVASDSNATSGCMELMDMGLGWFSFHGHDGNTTPTSGPDTFRGWVSISQSTQKDTTLSNVWEYGSRTGPFCGIHLRANGDNSEFVIIERIIVQEWR